MNLRRALLPLTALAALAGAVLGMPTSGATFVQTSTYGVTATAAGDWTPPTVSVDDPGPAIGGTATVSATALDSRSGVASVTIEYAVADSGSWQTLCTDATPPYSCSWSTTSGATAVPDGAYDLRATAVDNAGYSAVSAARTVRVVNTAGVVLSPVPDPLRGQVVLTGTYVNGGGATTASIWFEYAVAGSGSWKAVPGCGSNGVQATGRSCTWDTTTLTGEYDVRAVALNSLGRTTYDAQAGITVDNTAPTVSLTVPAGQLSGTVLLVATATDDDSGMATVTFQYRRTGASTWTDCGTDSTDPWSCTLRTASLADGSYDFRAVAVDVVGNTATTAVQTRTVNNTVSSVSISDPAAGDTVRGTVTVSADANSSAGVTSVAIQARPAGGAWAVLCTDTVAPYSCTWDTSAILSAGYELRAVLTAGGGTQTISASVAVTVDNQPLRAVDVQVANVAAAGLPSSGDRIVLTYSTVVDLATIKSGWAGEPTALSIGANDKAIGGAPRTGYDWFNLGTLGRLSVAQDYVRKNKSTTFAATMTAATQPVAGVPATVVTITLGQPAQSGVLRKSSVAGTVLWYPTTSVRTPDGLACSPATATESGVLDTDF